MAEVLFSTSRAPASALLVALYDSVGWTQYTSNPEALLAGVQHSLRVATAWTEGDELIGLARVVGDGHTIVYLQDVLVHPAWQRTGVGKWLVQEVFGPYAHVRQQVLLADDEPGLRSFYESMGFREIRDVDGGLSAFIRHGSD